MEQKKEHPAFLAYLNTVIAGWNVFMMVVYFMMRILHILIGSLVGTNPTESIFFWVAGANAVAVAAYAAYKGARHLHGYFSGLGMIGNCVWLTILLFLTAITFPGRIASV